MCSAGNDVPILLRSGEEPRQLDIDAGPRAFWKDTNTRSPGSYSRQMICWCSHQTRSQRPTTRLKGSTRTSSDSARAHLSPMILPYWLFASEDLVHKLKACCRVRLTEPVDRIQLSGIAVKMNALHNEWESMVAARFLVRQ